MQVRLLHPRHIAGALNLASGVSLPKRFKRKKKRVRTANSKFQLKAQTNLTKPSCPQPRDQISQPVALRLHADHQHLPHWPHFFSWTMLRSSLQLWQSRSCAKIVIGRQLDRKDWSATQDKARQAPTTQQANKKNPPVLTNLWKVKQVKRAHSLTTWCTKLWKTPALTTSSAACRKCQTSIMAPYLAAHWRPARH